MKIVPESACSYKTCDSGITVISKPRSRRNWSKTANVVVSVIVDPPSRLFQDLVPEAGEPPHGLGIDSLYDWNPNGHRRGAPRRVEPRLPLKVSLDMQPVSRVYRCVVHHKDNRH